MRLASESFVYKKTKTKIKIKIASLKENVSKCYCFTVVINGSDETFSWKMIANLGCEN